MSRWVSAGVVLTRRCWMLRSSCIQCVTVLSSSPVINLRTAAFDHSSPVQARANYGLGTICGPLSFLVWFKEHEVIIWILKIHSKNSVCFFYCFQSHSNKELNIVGLQSHWVGCSFPFFRCTLKQHQQCVLAADVTSRAKQTIVFIYSVHENVFSILIFIISLVYVCDDNFGFHDSF